MACLRIHPSDSLWNLYHQTSVCVIIFQQYWDINSQYTVFGRPLLSPGDIIHITIRHVSILEDVPRDVVVLIDFRFAFSLDGWHSRWLVTREDNRRRLTKHTHAQKQPAIDCRVPSFFWGAKKENDFGQVLCVDREEIRQQNLRLQVAAFIINNYYYNRYSFCILGDTLRKSTGCLPQIRRENAKRKEDLVGKILKWYEVMIARLAISQTKEVATKELL